MPPARIYGDRSILRTSAHLKKLPRPHPPRKLHGQGPRIFAECSEGGGFHQRKLTRDFEESVPFHSANLSV